MWDSQNDPLGIGLQSRAANRRMSFAQQNPGTSFGPGHSAAWDGFFQAMDEAGVSSMADNSVGVRRGMFDAKPALPSTYNPRFQSTAISGQSNQIGTPGIPSMQGLLRATKRTR